jgi:NAD(P)-dependent dehydrogenase (short-subunit alcohol dehydrogenase family)
MDFGLRGRVVIVCAASEGLGKAIAPAFAREEVHVVLCSRDGAKLAAAAEEIGAAAPPSSASRKSSQTGTHETVFWWRFRQSSN